MPLNESLAEPEVQYDPPPVSAHGARLPGKTKAVITACAILALPCAYLVLHKSASSSQLNNVAASAAPSVPALEALVHASPTVSNRINLSLAYINHGTPGAAVPVLETVVSGDPKNLVAWNNLCVAHTMQRNYKSALEECQRALLIDPTYQLARNNLKWAQDENNKALASLAAMAQTIPADRDAKFYMAEGLELMDVGNYDQSIDAWQHALQLDPKNAFAANNVGTAYMFKKQPATALQWFERALAADPALRLAQNNIAWANDELSRQK